MKLLEFFSWMSDPAGWVALATLTVMEIVLGIDNVVFISVLVARLPADQAERARKIGIALALVFRIILLMMLAWLIGLTDPIATLFGHGLSWRDVILLVGGLFLLFKATHEIHRNIEEAGEAEAEMKARQPAMFMTAIVQIAIIDIVFSIDSIVTAIGMAQHIGVMVTAVVLSMIVMYVASGPVARFVAEHPTTKMLALSFLILIGVSLVADGWGQHIPRGYIYFAMAFSTGVEVLNVIVRRRKKRANGGTGAPA
jgi:predicted tellurium resistance membrane protein TerC